jgi:AhpD family alkylhydroperoxidase
MNTENILNAIKEKFGFIPNLLTKMAQSPVVLRLYTQAQETMTEANLTAKEQQVIQLTISAFNKCDYCAQAHISACKGLAVSVADIEAISANRLPSDDVRLGYLVRATRLVLDKKGELTQNYLTELESIGIDRTQLYEIIALIGLKTITNYINHIEQTVVDPQFTEG